LFLYEGKSVVIDLDALGGVFGLNRRGGEDRGHRSPTCRTVSRASAQRGGSTMPGRAQPARIGSTPSAAMSFPVSTGTPACETSIDLMRACGCGERTSAQCQRRSQRCVAASGQFLSTEYRPGPIAAMYSSPPMIDTFLKKCDVWLKACAAS
jgi:hypothetical protein